MNVPLLVLLNGEPAAEIEAAPGQTYGGVTLKYRPELELASSFPPLSLSLLPSEAPHDPFKVHHWLDGLLPDNPELRNHWAGQYGVASDVLALLGTEIGYDCAGAVQFVTHADIGRLGDRESGLDPLSHQEMTRRVRLLDNWRNNIPVKDDFAFRQRSLAGWQPKMGVRYDGENWYEPYGNEPSTHIVKLDPVGCRHDTTVEFLCQTAARLLGLAAAGCSVMTFGSIDVIVYERYDRVVAPDSRILRVHQEDLCQAFGLSPDRKYQRDGGPDPLAAVGLLQRFSTEPQEDVLRFVDALLYSWLTGGSDAHAKNYSLLLAADDTRLGPLYDLSSDLPYRPAPDINMAMFPGLGTGRLSDLHRPAAWLDFAERANVGGSYLVERARQMAEDLPDALAEATLLLSSRRRRLPQVRALRDGVTETCLTVFDL